MNPEIQEYIENHIDAEPAYMHDLCRRSNLRMVNGRMCSGHLQGRLLKMLVSMANPRRVLELGTFTGYSALCIAEALEDDATVDTVEADDELEDFIRESLALSPCGHRVHLHIADALTFARGVAEDTYDMAFIDADKREYTDYYEACLRAVKPGGFIIADNTLWDSHVVEPNHFSDRQTAGIMRFNDLVAADPRVEKVILPLRDGLTLIRKLKDSPTR